jgi:AraC-like DNA-binding protein
VGGTDQPTIESAWLLRPVLQSIGNDKRFERLAAARLGPSFPGLQRIFEGARFRGPQPGVFGLLEDLAQETGDPEMGLRAIGCRPLETLLDYLCSSAANLGAALHTLAASNRLNNDRRIELQEREHICVVLPLGPGARQAADGMIASMVRIIRSQVGEAWVPQEVRVPHPRPANADRLEEVMGCPVGFGGQNVELHVARRDVLLPLRSSDPGLHQLLMRFAHEQLTFLPQHGNRTVDQARALLRESVRLGETSLAHTADRLKMSVRTLQRRLKEERTEYSALVDDARRELATQLLSSGKLRVLDVALAVGFRDGAGFNRAFRRWTGQRPGEFRKSRRSREP